MKTPWKAASDATDYGSCRRPRNGASEGHFRTESRLSPAS